MVPSHHSETFQNNSARELLIYLRAKALSSAGFYRVSILSLLLFIVELILEKELVDGLGYGQSVWG